MSDSIYRSPSADLEVSQQDVSEQRELSAAEKLAQSRREIEESEAVQRLNFVWGLRFTFDALICLSVLIGIALEVVSGVYDDIGIYGLGLIFFGTEIVFIVGYFRRKSWCVIPLHIFAGISLLNIPVGTILSIIHYLNMHKVEFDR